jgi:RNA polymerase sigma-70 factor (ECF subfamily)
MTWELIEALSPAEAGLDQAEETHFAMSEQEFRIFYAQTARPLWAYLRRLCGDAALAEDLLQEAFYRFLRAKLPSADDAYQRNYLFRIGTNLAHDHFRKTKRQADPLPDAPSSEQVAFDVRLRSDIERILQKLKPRERTLLWLTYVDEASHREIAQVTGLREISIRPMLFRARRRLAALLRKQGLGLDALERVRS